MIDFFGDPGPGFVSGDDEVRLEAAAAEVSCWPIDLEGVSSKQDLLAMLAADLDLPSWFGRNWDALVDVLSDPERVGARAALLLSGRAWLEERNPALATALTEVLLQAQGRATMAGGALWLIDQAGDHR